MSPGPATQSATQPVSRGRSAFSFRISERGKGLLAALLVVGCWSGFNIISRLGSRHQMTPFDLAALRFGVSGLIALPWFCYRRPRLPWARCGVLALWGGLGYSLLAYSGFSLAPSNHAGIFVNGCIPLWTLLLLALRERQRPTRRAMLACGLSLLGILVMSDLTGQGGGRDFFNGGDGLFFLAAGCWAAFGLAMRHWDVPPVSAILAVASVSCLSYLPVYWLFLPKALSLSSPGNLWLQALYQGIVVALGAGGLYSYANRKIGPAQASSMLALVPGGTALGAFFVLDEALGLPALMGILLVSAGALMSARLKPSGASGQR